jgi:hypothetical protein
VALMVKGLACFPLAAAALGGMAHAEIRHSVRLDAGWGTSTASYYSGSLWGAASASYGFTPHHRFQLDVGAGVRRLPTPVTQVEFHVFPRLVLAAGSLRWLPGLGVSAGPSFDSGLVVTNAVLHVEPLAMEIAYTRAIGFFFGAGLEVGLAGTYCSACAPTQFGGGSVLVGGGLGGYARTGVTYRF